MIVNNIIIAKSKNNHSKDLLTVDSYKFRKVYASKFDNKLYCAVAKFIDLC